MKLRVDDLCLSNLITAVRLNNGSTGLALNFNRQGKEPKVGSGLAEKLRLRLLERAESEPLLQDTLFDPQEGATFRSLSIALLNALSQPFMNPTHLTPRGSRFHAGRLPLEALQHLGGRVAVIGCGGYLEDALRADFVTDLVCSDLNFANPEADDHYRPYIENVIDPQRERMNIRLSDGRDNQEIVSNCDLLFITGSTLLNGTLFPLLEWAQGGPGAIVLEGNSAGLYPFPLFERGVTHLVQTVVDLDYVSLSRRFARHKAQGYLDIPDATYCELVLPEMRTLERLPTYVHRQQRGPRDKKILLLQARNWGDPMIPHEVDCFRERIPDDYELACYNLVEGPWDQLVLDDFCCVMVGGSGDYGAADNQHAWFSPTLELLRSVVDRGLPLFCSCWGHQALAAALGARVAHDEAGYELGLLPVELSPEGRRDELFSNLPSPFIAPLGHCEQVVELPPGAVLLASTQRCPIQAYRLAGKPVYSTQFHPELNSDRLWERVDAYIPHLREEAGDQQACTDSLVADFLHRFV